MKLIKSTIASVALSAAGITSAFASAAPGTIDTSLTYNSGILVLAFAGFLALVVVVQTIPAVISLYGMIKKAAEQSRQEAAEVTARK